MSDALFDYRLRHNPRGRNIRLRVTRQRGLEVIVPKNYDATKIPLLLERKKQWIRAALERQENLRKFFEPEPRWRPPLQIKLPAIGVMWHVVAKETHVEWVAVRELDDERLLVFGKIGDEKACRAALTRWLMRQTRANLIPRLQAIGLKTQLRYRRACIKRQRTRWASCSKHRTISLNVKLLFLPPEIVDYVMIHELCHIAVMNHSRAFWNLVRHHCPEYRSRDNRLRDMWKVVPRWAAPL
jgi:predicted metal-dependent hydrolase